MTLAARLLLLILLALLPPLAIQAWTGVEQRRTREAELRMQAVAQTRAVQADVARVADGVQQVLVTLAAVPAIRGGDAVACAAFLREVAGQFRGYALLSSTDATGDLLCNSVGSARASYSNANRAYFQRAMASGGFAAGDLVTSLTSGRPSIHFALPFRDAGAGAVGGIVLAGLDRDGLERLLAASALPRDALAVLLDPSGTVVAAARDNRPVRDAWVGQPASAALRAALRVTDAAAVEATGPDGKPRLFGAVPPDPALGGIVVAVALDQGRALADLQAATRRNLVGLLLGLLLAVGAGMFGAGRFVLAPLARLAAAADRVGRGELGARADLGRQAGALQEVGAAFNRMSAALANRESERDRAEAAQRAGEARLARLLATTPAGVVELNAGGRVTYANAAAERMLGAGPSGLIGQRYDDPAWMTANRDGLLIPLGDLPSTCALRGEPVLDHEHVVTTLDGRRAVMLADLVPVRDGTGQVEGALAAFQDVTARHAQAQALRDSEAALRQANETLEARVAARTAELTQAVDALHAEARERTKVEDALRQLQKMEAVGQLTGGIAHDFNNMLQAISGGLEMMGRRVEQGRTAEAAGYVASAQKTVARAAALTHRLLAFARRQALQPRPVAPDELVRGMAELIGRTAGPGVAVRLDLDDGTWPVLCDPNQLENVLLNLAINARDAMPEGGTLAIGTSNVRLSEAELAGQDGAAPGDYVEVAVRDTGTGMDEATRARAFEPFFTTKPIGQGTGLGLSQMYGFVRQSDGAVRLDSAPGAGTTVRMYLPRHQPAPDAMDRAPPQATPEPSGDGGTVLLVEDEAEVRATVADRLRDMGCTVLEAGDGAGALRLLRSCGRVDVLVTDVGLPGGLNGRQVADAARDGRPGLPVLFITGYAGAALEEALAPGMAMAGKPFTLDALAAQVGAMLAAGR